MRERKLFRSKDNRWIGGVLAGIAKYFNWDVDVVRLAYVFLTIFTAFSGVLAYLVVWLVIPSDIEV